MRHLINVFRQPGLSGMPPGLQHLREEVGLSGEHWETSGSTWHTLAGLWLRAEVALCKSGRTDLSFKEIHQSVIPSQWKDWMCAKLMKMDMAPPSDTFGKIFTDYLSGLPVSTLRIGGSVMEEVWSRPGKTGIIGLLLCLFWQAEYSSAGKDWQENITRVESIFKAILAIPEL